MSKAKSRGKTPAPAQTPVDRLTEGEAAAELERLAREIAITTRSTTGRTSPRSPTPSTMRCASATQRSRRASRISIREDSPSVRVGAEPVEAFGKVMHSVPMLSLGNVFDDDGVRDFLERIRRFLGLETVEGLAFTAEPKIDGLSITLRYEKGRLGPGGHPRRRLSGRERHRQCPHHSPTSLRRSKPRASPTPSRCAARSI